jgi:rod shape-determining protein MreC
MLLFGIIFFIGLMGLTLSNRSQLTWPEKFVRDTVGWVQGVVAVPASAVQDFFGEWQQIRAVHEENEALRQTLAESLRMQVRLNQLEAENERLQAALGFTNVQKRFHQYVFHYADVISFSGDHYNKTIVINRGSADGVKVDMAVASVDGLVGRVASVSRYYATVQLLVDLSVNNEVSKPIAATAKGKENRSFGIVDSYDRHKGFLRMSKIEQNDPLRKGDVVVTSGIGGVFPAGLAIGKVISREEGSYGITHVAEIEPAADFAKLREVFVIQVPIAEEAVKR